MLAESMKALVTALVLAAAVASVVAGCGGGKSAEEEWAGNVCTDVANWQSQVKTATSNIMTPTNTAPLGETIDDTQCARIYSKA